MAGPEGRLRRASKDATPLRFSPAARNRHCGPFERSSPKRSAGPRMRGRASLSGGGAARETLPEYLALGVLGLHRHRLARRPVAEAKRRVLADRDAALHAPQGPVALAHADRLHKP